jgi:hypothetical protein
LGQGDWVTVRCFLRNAGRSVRVKVYTYQAKRCDSREFQGLPQGWNDLSLELRNEWGESLENGLYWIKMDIEGRSERIPLVILR